VRGIRPDKDKLTRFMPLLTRYEKRMVRHDPARVPAWFREELLSFPEGQHDDGADAAALGFAALAAAGPIEFSSSGKGASAGWRDRSQPTTPSSGAW
jgi:phage terminase large subunit-like protein